MREYATPPVATVDPVAGLADPVWHNAARFPDVVQFARPTDPGWTGVTCAEFRDQVIRLARGFLAAGVRPGARVGLMSRTRYEWTLVDYALLAIGAVVVPLYDTASRDQVRWILTDSGAVGCVVESAAHGELVRDIAGELPGAFQVWGIDEGALDRLEPAGVTPDEVDRHRQQVHADDPATIIYTSGTTGSPKGCLLTHRNLLTEVRNTVPSLPDLFEQENAATLLFLPLAHAFARLVQLGCVEARATLGHLPDPQQLLVELPAFRPTFLLAIPRVFEKLHDGARRQAGGGVRGALFARAEATAVAYSAALDTPAGPGRALRWRRAGYDRLLYRRLRNRLGGRCTTTISGGAALSPRLAHFFRGAGLTVYEGYGLTETSPAVTANVAGATRIGTVGRPLPGVAVRTADDGEIQVRGDVVFGGYWNNPEATSEVFTADGWLRTGDLGQLDADGFLTVTGRLKELIVTASGKNVSPSMLEDRIRTHPLVSQAVVVGERRPYIAALVTIDEQAWPRWLAAHGKPAGATVAQLRDDPDLASEVWSAVDFANQAVSQPEQVKRFRVLPRDFTVTDDELTPTMKIKRSVVEKEYAHDIDEIYRR